MPLAGESLVSSLAQGAVKSVTFRSQVTPDYTYDPWAPAPPPPPDEGSGWLMNFVKPAVTIETAMGPVEVAPYGEPTENYGQVVLAGGLAALVGVIVLIGWLARKV
jgi:hypothetical protein